MQGQCLFLLSPPYKSVVNIFNHLGTFTSFLPCWETAELSVSLVHLCPSLLSSPPYFLFQLGEECPAERILSYPCWFFVDHSIQGVRQETDIFQTWSVMRMWTFWSLCLGIRTDGGFPGHCLSCVYLKMLMNHNLVCLSWKCFNVLVLRFLSFLNKQNKTNKNRFICILFWIVKQDIYFY